MEDSDPGQMNLSPTARKALVAIVLALLLVTALGRWFDGFEPDDLQHLHAAWLVSQGLVPYRDYFDHHTPLYHLTLGPYAGSIGRDPLVLMVTFRILALLCAAGTFYLFWRLIARSAGPVMAWLALGLLAASRHSDLLFSLRPDYIALLLLMLAVTLVTETGPPSPIRAFVTGFCVGLAFGFTQKVLALAPAFIFWQGIALYRATAEARPPAFRSLLLLIGGIATPPSLLVLILAQLGALPGFLSGPIGFASHWVQPERFIQYTQEPVLLEFGVFVIGFAWALLSAWKWVRRDEVARADSLVGLLLIFGTAGLLKTPAPTQQAYMITMSLWVHASAAFCLIRLCSTKPETSNLKGWFAAGLALSLWLLTYYNMPVALLGWGLIYGLYRWRSAHYMERGMAAAWAAGVLGFAAAIASIGTAGDRVIRNSARPQVQAMREIDRHVGEGESVLTAWPIYTPFRSHATFHWFSDPGMYTSMPLTVLESEYLQAARNPATALVVIEPGIVRQFIPRVMDEIEHRFRELTVPPGSLSRAKAFVRR